MILALKRCILPYTKGRCQFRADSTLLARGFILYNTTLDKADVTLERADTTLVRTARNHPREVERTDATLERADTNLETRESLVSRVASSRDGSGLIVDTALLKY